VMVVEQYVGICLGAVKQHWGLFLVAFFVLRAFKRRYLSPVSDVPALNFLSTISRLGKVREVLSGHGEKTILEAHRKHGECNCFDLIQLKGCASLLLQRWKKL
jgi:hypothetical protein